MNLPQTLADQVAETNAKVRQGYPWWLRPWLMSDVVAITLGHRVYLSTRLVPESVARILRHELAHVRQINRLGLFVFYWRYVSEFAKHFSRVRSWNQAYAMLSFEREAVAAEEEAVL